MTQPWQPDPYQRRPVDINAYAPPRSGGGGWWLLLLGGALIGLVVSALFLRPPPAAPEPSPSPSQGAPSEASGPGMPFTMPGAPNSTGRWEVVSHSWVADGLVVRVRVTADAGRVTYGFVAFSNAGTEVYEPEAGAPSPEIGTGRLAVGQSVEGNVFLPMPRGDATLILTNEAGRQMSALPVPG